MPDKYPSGRGRASKIVLGNNLFDQSRVTQTSPPPSSPYPVEQATSPIAVGVKLGRTRNQASSVCVTVLPNHTQIMKVPTMAGAPKMSSQRCQWRMRQVGTQQRNISLQVVSVPRAMGGAPGWLVISILLSVCEGCPRCITRQPTEQSGRPGAKRFATRWYAYATRKQS